MSEEMKEYQPDLFTLEDENGNEEVFELIDVYQENDMTYYALVPHNDEDDGYFVILKQDSNEPTGDLVSIDDEDELDRLGEIFLQRIFEEADDEECCCDDDCCCHDDDCGCCH